MARADICRQQQRLWQAVWCEWEESSQVALPSPVPPHGSSSLRTEKWAVVWANVGERCTSLSSPPLAYTLGEVEISYFEELDREEERKCYQNNLAGFPSCLWEFVLKASGETTPPVWTSVKERTCIYKIITSHHLSAYLGKKCVGGKCVLFAQKSRNVHVFSEIKLRSGSAINCKKNFSNNRPLATAKQTPLL